MYLEKKPGGIADSGVSHPSGARHVPSGGDGAGGVRHLRGNGSFLGISDGGGRAGAGHSCGGRNQAGARVKHFRRSDGSYVAAIYSEPVHYEKDGKLLDIDNTLVEKDGYYTNTANSLVVRLPKQASTSRPITVEHQGKTLRFFMEGQQTASAALQQADSGESISRLSASASKADKQREKNERKLQAKKQHAAVTYPESLDGASLTYDVKGSSLKESLILKKLTGRKSYSFKIEAEGLRAEVQADSSVHFYAEGTEEPAFIIASPYMFDAAGEYSSAVAVEVKKTGNHYRYTLTPDRAWLEDSARVWPVTDTAGSIKDTGCPRIFPVPYCKLFPSAYTECRFRKGNGKRQNHHRRVPSVYQASQG